MELHQLLRFISFTTPICILDIQGIKICEVDSKCDIPIGLYEYPILELKTMITTLNGYKHSICITIQK